MKRKIFIATLLILAGLLSLWLRPVESFTREGFSMNTLIRMTAYARDEKILDEAYSLLNKLDKELSLYDPSSDISRINFLAGSKKFFAAPPEVIEVISKSLELYEITNGIFNPLIGPVTKLWKINKADNKIPSPESLDAAIKLSNIKNLELDSKTNQLYLKLQGCEVDLGGIAKGYASEKIAELFKSRGVESGLIDLGGNIYVTGRKPDGSDWKIGVRDPSSPWGAPALVLSVHDTSVITSGGYERFKVVNGEKYTHFFDSKTGKPVKNNLLSATLVTPDGSLGDGLATAFMVGGYEKSLSIIKNLPASVGAILILQNEESKLEIFASENLRGVIVRSNYPVKFFGREVSGGSDRFF